MNIESLSMLYFKLLMNSSIPETTNCLDCSVVKYFENIFAKFTAKIFLTVLDSLMLFGEYFLNQGIDVIGTSTFFRIGTCSLKSSGKRSHRAFINSWL